MKILTLSNYYPEHVGGIEFVALNLVTNWRENHQVRWLACDVKRHHHLCGPDDIPLPALNFTEDKLGFPYPVPVGGSVFRIIEQVKWSQIVHLHDCLYLANLITFMVARWYRKPLVVTQHTALSSFPQAYKRFLQRLAYDTFGRLILKNADKVVFISSRVKNWFEGRINFKHTPEFFPNGVDHSLFFPPSLEERESSRARLGFTPNQLVLLFIGRFMPNKGVYFVHSLAQARPDVRWLMLGDGGINPRQWSLPNVQVIPPRPHAELREYYIAADIFVLPSAGEGFPLTVQEALSCGLPAAVSHETAAQFPDAPLIKLDIDTLSVALQVLDNLFSDQEKIRLLGTVSAEYAQRWDWHKVSGRYERLFMQLI